MALIKVALKGTGHWAGRVGQWVEVPTWWGPSCRRQSWSTWWEDEGKEPAPAPHSPRAGEGEGVSDKDCASSQRLRTSAFVMRRLRIPGECLGSGWPGSRLGRQRPRGRDGAGPGFGGARDFHHGMWRGIATRSGDSSGRATSSELSVPHSQVEPSGRPAAQTLRARMGEPHKRHMHMQ